MFTLPHKPTHRTPPDFSQMLILCSLALLVSLILPARGSFVILTQIVVDIVQTGTVDLPRLAVPIVALAVAASSFAAFRSRRRVWALPVLLGSIYVFQVTELYLRERAWSMHDPPQAGSFLLFASNAFLVIISLLYMVWPGKRPQRVVWWRPEPRVNRLVRIAAVLFGAGVICVQNGMSLSGYGLMLVGVAISYHAHVQ